MRVNDDLSRVIAAAARDLQSEVGSQSTMERALELAIKMIDGCEHAGISLIKNGRISSPATSDTVVTRVDELQLEHDQGPALDAIREQPLVHSADLAADERWPEWGARTAAETGIHSMVSFRLFTTSDTVGALTLYATLTDAFDAEAREIGVALAAHVALALVSSREIESLRSGLDTRTVIGQASGMLMERYGVEPVVAFAVLKRISQDTNRKLREVAVELVSTRRMPSGTA